MDILIYKKFDLGKKKILGQLERDIAAKPPSLVCEACCIRQLL